jgi:WhiB family redox-sensing transcriptional regulator
MPFGKRVAKPREERSCPMCGGPMTGKHATYCLECLRIKQAEYRSVRNARHRATVIVDSDDDWRDQANCKHKTSMMYPFGEEYQMAIAKYMCDNCPVRQECLLFALTNHIDDGVWGGTTENERRRLQRRNRGRSVSHTA